MERLHKYLAHCGIASRRKSEEIILEGRVEINGEVVMELGVQVDPRRDKITVDGKPVHTEEKVYFLMNKPKGYTTTAEDELGRKTVLDLLEPDVCQRVYPAGRLDRDSEGLVVLTNDGNLSYFLTHPSKGVKKVYHATVEGELTDETVEKVLEKGVRLGPVLIKPLALKVLRRGSRTSVVEVTVAEGVNREVRRMFAVLEHEVKKLVRISIGPLLLKGIPRGKYRTMRRQELALLGEWMERGGSKGAAELAQKLRGRGGRGSSGARRATGKPDPANNKGLATKKRPRKIEPESTGTEWKERHSRNIQVDGVGAAEEKRERRPLGKKTRDGSKKSRSHSSGQGASGFGKSRNGNSKNRKRAEYDYSSGTGKSSPKKADGKKSYSKSDKASGKPSRGKNVSKGQNSNQNRSRKNSKPQKPSKGGGAKHPLSR